MEVGGGPGEHSSGGTGVLTCVSSPHTPLPNPLLGFYGEGAAEKA
jgi:hypothetical protein